MSLGTAPLGTVPLGTSPSVSVGGVVYSRTLSDSANAYDQQQAYEEKLRLLLSTVNINDTLIRTLQLAGAAIERILSSGINVNDLIGSDKLLNRLLGSDVKLSDAIQSFTGIVLDRILKSDVSLYDVIGTEKDLTRLLTEVLVVTDAVLQDKNLFRLLQDNLDLVDIIARLVTLTPQTYSRILSDNTALQDLIIRETTGQIIQLILTALTRTYDVNIDIDKKNIIIDSVDI